MPCLNPERLEDERWGVVYGVETGDSVSVCVCVRECVCVCVCVCVVVNFVGPDENTKCVWEMQLLCG